MKSTISSSHQILAPIQPDTMINRPYTKLASYPTNIVVTPLTTDPRSNSQYTKVIILGVSIESKKKISFIIIP